MDTKRTTSPPRRTAPTTSQRSPDRIAPETRQRIDFVRLTLLHIAEAHGELTVELGRPPSLRELRFTLLAERGVDRSRRELSRDLTLLDLPRTSATEACPPKPERPPKRIALPSDSELGSLSLIRLQRLVRKARWHGDQAAFNRVLALIPDDQRESLAECLARPAPWES